MYNYFKYSFIEFLENKFKNLLDYDEKLIVYNKKFEKIDKNNTKKSILLNKFNFLKNKFKHSNKNSNEDNKNISQDRPILLKSNENLTNTYKKNEASSQICVMPPILKKIGLKTGLIFPIIKNPALQSGYIKRPIRLVFAPISGQIKIYNLKDFDFCLDNDFEKDFYNITDINPNEILNLQLEKSTNTETKLKKKKSKNLYWPNKSLKNEEHLRVCLQLLYKAFSKTNLVYDFDNEEYKNYIEQIKKLFPENFFKFYKDLQENEIVELPLYQKENRAKFFDNISQSQKEGFDFDNKTPSSLNDDDFFKTLFRKLSTFVISEIMPSLQGTGAYTKLLFYEKVGEFIKNFDKSKYKNISANQEENNDKKFEIILGKLKIEIIKIYSKIIDNEISKDVTIDTISIILIVFLNALLIEEKKKAVLKDFEQEIEESKLIFQENISSVKNTEARNKLQKYFDNLCSDYFEENKDNFSNLYKGYLFVFS